MKQLTLLIDFNSNGVCLYTLFILGLWNKGREEVQGKFEMKTSEECNDKNRSGVRQQGEWEVQGNNRAICRTPRQMR